MTPPSNSLGEIINNCDMCKGAGLVWARSHAFPTGFKAFVGSAVNRSEDRQHIEIVCPQCSGQAARILASDGG